MKHNDIPKAEKATHAIFFTLAAFKSMGGKGEFERSAPLQQLIFIKTPLFAVLAVMRTREDMHFY